MVGIGSNLHLFINPPSVIMIVTFTLGALWMAVAPIGTMFSSVFSSGSTPEQLTTAAQGWALARRSAVASGFIGVLIGAVIILSNLDDIGALGPGVAFCIMTMFYSLLLGYGFCLPCQYYAESRAVK
jgi:flagellar motor component MotA